MRRRRPIPLVLCLATGLLAWASMPALASCGPRQSPRPPGDPVFTGELLSEVGSGTAGTLFEFRVDWVERGQVPERVIVDIAVDKEFRQPDGEVIRRSSSISIGSPPAIGETYRVEPYRGNPGGQSRLFVNACGGNLRRVATERAASDPRSPKVAIGATGVVLLGLAIYLRRRLAAPVGSVL